LAGGQSRLEPLPAAAVRELWAIGSTGLEMKLPHHQPQIEALLKNETYRLYFGDDIQAGVDLLEAVFNK
jgi:hypothetical protein